MTTFLWVFVVLIAIDVIARLAHFSDFIDCSKRSNEEIAQGLALNVALLVWAVCLLVW